MGPRLNTALEARLGMAPFESLRAAAGFGLPGEVWQEYAGYGFSAVVERCHPPMIELMF